MAQQTVTNNHTLTAVEWLAEKLIHAEPNILEWDKYIKQAKQMQKEQIMNAWRNGDNDSMYEPKQLDEQAEQYYNETYGK
jgi:hypothetical protein